MPPYRPRRYNHPNRWDSQQYHRQTMYRMQAAGQLVRSVSDTYQQALQHANQQSAKLQKLLDDAEARNKTLESNIQLLEHRLVDLDNGTWDLKKAIETHTDEFRQLVKRVANIHDRLPGYERAVPATHQQSPGMRVHTVNAFHPEWQFRSITKTMTPLEFKYTPHPEDSRGLRTAIQQDLQERNDKGLNGSVYVPSESDDESVRTTDDDEPISSRLRPHKPAPKPHHGLFDDSDTDDDDNDEDDTDHPDEVVSGVSGVCTV